MCLIRGVRQKLLRFESRVAAQTAQSAAPKGRGICVHANFESILSSAPLQQSPATSAGFCVWRTKESGKNPPVRKPRSGADRATRGPQGEDLSSAQIRINPPECAIQQSPRKRFFVWRTRSLVRTLRFESRVAAQTAQSAAPKGRGICVHANFESIPPSGVQSTPSGIAKRNSESKIRRERLFTSEASPKDALRTRDANPHLAPRLLTNLPNCQNRRNVQFLGMHHGRQSL